MTHPSLDSAYAKLGRAGKHLYDLKVACSEYVIGEPEGVTHNFESQVPEEGNKPGIAVRVALEEPSTDMALLAGDAIQNIRSALDHLANAMVRRNGGIPNENTLFPIFQDRLGAKGGIKDVEIQPRASALANTIVEGLQPYHRTDDPTLHPLAVLQHLSNIDKHRRLNLLGGFIGDVEVIFWKSGGPRTLRVFRPKGLAQNGALLGFFPSTSPVSFMGMNVQVNHSIQVGIREFGEGGESPIETLIDDLLTFTKEKIVNRFCRRVFRSEPPKPWFPW